MASRSKRTMAFVVVLLLFFLANSAHASRKLLGGTGLKVPSLEDALVFSALPKGSSPPSSPSPGINSADLVGERLSAGRTSPIDRMLGSVPSPGVGH